MIDYGHGVKLRRLFPEDMNQTYVWRNDMRVWHWCRQNDLLHPQGHDAWFRAQASDPTVTMFMIEAIPSTIVRIAGDPAVDENTPQRVGVCGLTGIDLTNRRAEFSCYIGPEHQKNGYGRKALQTLFTHGFKNLNLNCIWGETFDGNSAARLFKRIGMKSEGFRRQFYFRDGEYKNAELFSVLASEWEAR